MEKSGKGIKVCFEENILWPDSQQPKSVSQCRHRQWANCMMDKTQLEGKWEKQSDRERGKREREEGRLAGSTIGHQRFLATADTAALFEVSPSAAAAKGVKERERSLIHLLHSFSLFLSGDSKREREMKRSPLSDGDKNADKASVDQPLRIFNLVSKILRVL